MAYNAVLGEMRNASYDPGRIIKAGADGNVTSVKTNRATKPDGKATITGPHVMVVGPGVKGVPGYDRTGNGVNPAIPYVMWKDTEYEHLMIPVR
jgi:hypothetical protein